VRSNGRGKWVKFAISSKQAGESTYPVEHILIITNLPDRTQALALAQKLVEARLIACVNVLADCTSVYQWQGKSETASEVPLFIKTLAQHYPAVEQLIKSEHPYELPEIIAVPISSGLPAYLKWIADETSSTATSIEDD
jgi:periplasmic divalent cation tolerance protein